MNKLTKIFVTFISAITLTLVSLSLPLLQK